MNFLRDERLVLEREKSIQIPRVPRRGRGKKGLEELIQAYLVLSFLRMIF